ncbi:ATP-dependent DNA helicase II subunit 1 [Mytilinidion resinicola]|uniref:ATP-dependent DNA helicase II subunit 1 n=1 Tax=Mytilinidion resinicola TaxID=574789 RepID=A0A6A6YLD3_9PEZI|nr:ATP-dependent DNA helicase II subunit 1 [Mytilinidion resinicola]KAF2808784.1 ATP-dependent DNA helicase II subunit 1 [Mytilinidion resinicola]
MAEPTDEKRRHGEEEEDDDEEEADESGYKTVKDAVLFAIDVSDSMLRRPPPSDDKKADRDSPTSAALKCAYQLMQQRIISHPKDMMGILLFGTEDTRFDEINSGDQSYPHCYLLADLDVPEASDVKRLRSLVEDEEEAAKLLVPAKEGVTMANLLFCANQIFTTRAPNFSSRRLFLVTDNDNPAADKGAKDNAITRARDLYDLGVIIELFPISKPGVGFDRAKFYDDLVYSASPSDPDAPAPISSATKVSSSGDGISLLQSLISSINSKAAPRRALFSLPLELGPDLRIGVKGYVIIKRQAAVKSCYIWMGGENGEKKQLAVVNTMPMTDDSVRAVEKVDLVKAYKFGGEAVTFPPEQIKLIRQCFGDPIIRIIGFKPVSMLPIWANTRTPTFIYPSEADYIGSTRVFSALQQKLLKDNKMALVWYIARKNAGPVIAALVPGVERLGEGGEQVMPPGMWLIPLPFVDDIRDNPDISLVKTTDDLTDLMRNVVQQLQLPKAIYDPSRYPNPGLQWFYRILQSLALEEDMPEKLEDKTVPKYRQIDKRAGEFVVEWGQALESEHALRLKNRSNAAALKRESATDKLSGPLPKRIKTERGATPAGEDEADSDEKMLRFRKTGAVRTLTMDRLRKYLGSRGLGTKGKKGDLVQRVEEYLETI